ncbi:MAG: hypothetical protein ACKVOK_03305 [Flavobacteriales bacterium]
MKKALFLSICFAAFGFSAKAQESNSFFEIGLNATPFVSQYLDFNSDDNDIISPYMLTAERRLDRIGFRLGLGVVSTNRLEQPDDDNTEPKIRFKSTVLAARGGLVLYKDISKRFSLKYGADLYFMRDGNVSETTTVGFFGNEEVSTVTSAFNEYGLSPFLFLQLHVTPNFSLGTELLAKFSYSEGVEKEENTQFPEFNDEQKTKTGGFRIDAPTSLFFILRF